MASTHPTWFTEQRHRSFGKCFTIHPDQKTRLLKILKMVLFLHQLWHILFSRDLGIYYMKLVLWVWIEIQITSYTLIETAQTFSKYPIKLYLHRNKQFLDLSGRMGYFVHLNESTQHQVVVLLLTLRMIMSSVIYWGVPGETWGLHTSSSTNRWRCQLQGNWLWSVHVQGINT